MEKKYEYCDKCGQGGTSVAEFVMGMLYEMQNRKWIYLSNNQHAEDVLKQIHNILKKVRYEETKKKKLRKWTKEELDNLVAVP